MMTTKNIGIVYLCTFFIINVVYCPEWSPLQDECPAWEQPCHPTLTAADNFDVEKAKKDLLMAIQNKNVQAVILLLTRKVARERALMKTPSLLSALNENFFGQHLQTHRLVHALFDNLQDFYATELKINIDATSAIVIDILGPLSKVGLKAVKSSFKAIWGYSLNLATSDRDEQFWCIINRLIECERIEGKIVNEEEINYDIHRLQSAKTGEDYQNIFCDMIFNRNLIHLRRVCQRHPFLNELNHFKTYFGDSLESLYQITTNRVEYFARRLGEALLIKDYETIRFILVARAEIDMENIKYAYPRLHGNRRLHSDIAIKFSDRLAYRNALLNLINEPANN